MIPGQPPQKRPELRTDDPTFIYLSNPGWCTTGGTILRIIDWLDGHPEKYRRTRYDKHLQALLSYPDGDMNLWKNGCWNMPNPSTPRSYCPMKFAASIPDPEPIGLKNVRDIAEEFGNSVDQIDFYIGSSGLGPQIDKSIRLSQVIVAQERPSDDRLWEHTVIAPLLSEAIRSFRERIEHGNPDEYLRWMALPGDLYNAVACATKDVDNLVDPKGLDKDLLFSYMKSNFSIDSSESRVWESGKQVITFTAENMYRLIPGLEESRRTSRTKEYRGFDVLQELRLDAHMTRDLARSIEPISREFERHLARDLEHYVFPWDTIPRSFLTRLPAHLELDPRIYCHPVVMIRPIIPIEGSKHITRERVERTLERLKPTLSEHLEQLWRFYTSRTNKAPTEAHRKKLWIPVLLYNGPVWVFSAVVRCNGELQTLKIKWVANIATMSGARKLMKLLWLLLSWAKHILLPWIIEDILSDLSKHEEKWRQAFVTCPFKSVLTAKNCVPTTRKGIP